MASFVAEHKGRFYTVLIDASDWASWASAHEWTLSSKGYVVSKDRPQITLHRRVLGVTSRKILVDHKNHNKLDNQKSNLRRATPTQNAENNSAKSQYAGRERPSQYKGVSLRRGRWRMNIKLPDGTRIDRLFPSEEEAARAYDELARKYQKEFATLNFPDEAPS